MGRGPAWRLNYDIGHCLDGWTYLSCHKSQNTPYLWLSPGRDVPTESLEHGYRRRCEDWGNMNRQTSYNCHGWLKERTKVQRGQRTCSLIKKRRRTKQCTLQNKTVKLKAKWHKESQLPTKHRWGKRLWFPIRDNDRQLSLIENHTRPKHRDWKS